MEDVVKFDQELTDLLEESRSEIENSFNTIAAESERSQELEEALKSSEAQVGANSKQKKELEEALKASEAQVAAKSERIKELDEALKQIEVQIATNSEWNKELEEALKASKAQGLAAAKRVKELGEALAKAQRTDAKAESAKPTQNQKPKGCEEKGASFLLDDLAENEGPNNLQEINPPSNETDSNNRGDSMAMESSKHATLNIIAPDAECVPEVTYPQPHATHAWWRKHHSAGCSQTKWPAFRTGPGVPRDWKDCAHPPKRLCALRENCIKRAYDKKAAKKKVCVWCNHCMVHMHKECIVQWHIQNDTTCPYRYNKK